MRFRHAILAVVLFPLLSFAPKREVREYVINGFAQGTTYKVRYFAADSLIKKHAVDSIFSALDSSLSLYKNYSLISRFNASEKGVEMDVHLATIMKKLPEMRFSHGWFEPTIAPLVQLWGFGPKPIEKLPTDAEVKKTLECVGFNRLKIVGNRLTKSKPCVQLDLNGIAQGYSVDVISNYLRKYNLSSYLVEVGGEIYVGGPRPDGTFFKVGIARPLDMGGDTIAHVVGIKQGAITTSAKTKKYIEREGKFVHHIIHPIFGYPEENNTLSVTIFAKDAITADGYDNLLLASGVTTIKNNLRLMVVEAYVVYLDERGKVAEYHTPNFFKALEDDVPVVTDRRGRPSPYRY